MQDHADHQSLRQDFLPKLKASLARIPFAEDLLAAWFCAIDNTTPLKVRATLWGALAYFVLPFDVVPDMILGLGFTDDLAVLFTALNLVRNHITPAHRARAKAELEKLKSGAGSSAAQS
jgi:uncharacterized membrane protein YkvA (DUF1232 family)